MSDRIQRVMVYLIAMAMVTAVAAAPTVAQVVDPEAERVYEVTANADTVDGFHAIGATGKKSLRARKLVATNKYGQLPSNIIRPRWRELKGVPATFKDGVIGWYEVDNKPVGFDDNVDDVGVWQVTVTTTDYASVIIPAGDGREATATCPAGTKVIGGAFQQVNKDIRVSDMYWYNNIWHVYGMNVGNSDETLYVSATCLATKPSGAIASRGNSQPASKK